MGGDRLIPHVLSLMADSESHSGFTVPQIIRCILPPLYLGQHTGIVEDDRLQAWCSWAFMTPEKADAFLDGNYRIQSGDWAEGTTLVFMDFIAPYGHARKLYRECRRLFGTQPAGWIRHTKGKKRAEVFHGQ